MEGCGLERIERIHHPCFTGTSLEPPATPAYRATPRTLSSYQIESLYYFFYQSARFQDALRPAESCVINHEM